MPGHRTENRISFWGYFGFGWPLLGFLLAVAIIVLLAILDFPIPAAFFALLSMGLLYGVYKSCQATGREGVNVQRMRGRGREPLRNRGVTNQGNRMILELAASALSTDHPAMIGSFPSHASVTRMDMSPPADDQPPDYYEVTGISKSIAVPPSGHCTNSTRTGGESGWPSLAPLTCSSSVGDLGSNTMSNNNESDILAVGNPPLALFRLPSYDEAVASSQRTFGSDCNTVE